MDFLQRLLSNFELLTKFSQQCSRTANTLAINKYRLRLAWVSHSMSRIIIQQLTKHICVSFLLNAERFLVYDGQASNSIHTVASATFLSDLQVQRQLLLSLTGNYSRGGTS